MLYKGDCLEVMKTFEENTIDALVTDPPAGISFMGKEWDDDKGGRKQWIAWMTEVMSQCLRVMKPGAHGLVWALPRTSHWTATALEDAGFEVRDVVTHLFGTGFPKSHDISKAIDKAAGAEREILEQRFKNGDMRGAQNFANNNQSGKKVECNITAPSTEAAKQWAGWGTALKPAAEHWILVRKPCSEKTVAANVLKWGVGGINIDASRIEASDHALLDAAVKRMTGNTVQDGGGTTNFVSGSRTIQPKSAQGRFPANLVLDEEAAVVLDEQSGPCQSKGGGGKPRSGFWGNAGEGNAIKRNDSGGASRFFYVAKAGKSDKNDGLESFPDVSGGIKNSSGRGFSEADPHKTIVTKNNHPTVKSTALMSYLIKLVTPRGGTVLDPFMGSGSTGKASKQNGFEFIGIEKDENYFSIAEARVSQVFL